MAEDKEQVYERIKKFHAHLDDCSQCRNHPFDLCSIGAELLKAAASGEVLAPKKSIIKFSPSFRESMRENLGWSEEAVREFEWDIIKSQRMLREGMKGE